MAELSALLRHNPHWTGAYLGELLEMGLVATTKRTCGDVWWPTSAGRTLGTPQPKAEAS
ncbi:hypothetical protein ACFVAV_20820 [Nocardia sp. NPDC057663]|uniref:hypothetical protein n=1 Tax=Nocardia sp. NPDC057663 TaxID=3346201 RepID=UPI00366ADE92